VEIAVGHWSLTSFEEKLVRIGAKVVSHGRYVTFQMAAQMPVRELKATIKGCRTARVDEQT
jgi:hypothetical protein